MASDAAPQDAPFKLSVMLWTVFIDLSFEQRLEKVAEAGYRYVQLVGEYEKWSEDDFNRANAKRKQLGISFDATAGLRHGLSNPAEREALLADLREALGDAHSVLRRACHTIMSLSLVSGPPAKSPWTRTTLKPL